MRKVVLCGHGRISEGIASAAGLIAGNQPEYFNAYTDEEIPFAGKIRELAETLSEGDALIIMTDLFGGSVNNELLNLTRKEGVHLLCGMNLAMVLSVLFADEKADIKEVMADAVREAKEGIRYCNELHTDEELDEF